MGVANEQIGGVCTRGDGGSRGLEIRRIMESVIEEQRRLFEEKERLEDSLVKEKLLKKNTVRL